MAHSHDTRWSIVRRAAEGEDAARAEFARVYESVIRAYLGARWRRSPLAGEIDDAVQEVFLACFKEEGALGRADPERPGGFGAYLYGVVRNVARRAEEKRARREKQPDSAHDLREIEAREAPLSKIFDRAWARALIAQAAERHAERARAAGADAQRRVELLRLRFGEDLPIREIARRWQEDPTRLHHDYARARSEFSAALREVVKESLDGSPRSLDAECARLAAYLRA